MAQVVGHAVMRMCPQCGLLDSANPCRECHSDKTQIQPIPVGAVGMACCVGDGLKAQEGLVIAQRDDQVRVLVQGGHILTVPTSSALMGGSTPGVESALSPAGALLMMLISTSIGAMQGKPEALLEIAVEEGSQSLRHSRLLAIDAVRLGMEEEVLPRLPLTEGETLWMRAQRAASRGDWQQTLALLAQLPPDRYWPRIGMLLAARRDILQTPHRDAVQAFLIAHRHEPLSALLSAYLTSGGRPQRDVLIGIAESIDPRITQLLVQLKDGQEVRDFLDISPAVEAYDAVTSPHGPEVRGELLRGKSREFIDELIDRGRLLARGVPEYRSWLSGDDAAYLTARLDPRQLSDEEVAEFGPESERERRAFNRGELKIRDLKTPAITERLEIVDKALRGDPESMQRAVELLSPTDLTVLMDCQESARSKAIPGDRALNDRTVWESLEREIGADHVLTGAPHATSPLQKHFVGWVALRHAKESLYSWQWTDCRTAASTVLRVSDNEQLTDEALNLIAAAHWQLGQDEAAIAALDKALEGEYTTALQVNAVVVASESRPAKAAGILSVLTRNAPTTRLQVSAAQRGLALWQDKFPDEPLPPGFITSLRSVVVEHIDLDDFTMLAGVLADHDADWFGRPTALSSSPHVSNPRARILQGSARGAEDHIKAIANALRDPAGRDDSWVKERRDIMVAVMIQAMTTQDEAIGAANVAYEAIDSKMPMRQRDRLTLTLLAAREFALAIDVQEGCLNDERVNEAITAWNQVMKLPYPDRDDVMPIALNSMDIVIRHLCRYYWVNMDPFFLTDYDQRYGSQSVIYQKIGALRFWSTQACERLIPMRQMASDRDTQEMVNGLIQQCIGILEG